MKQSKLTKLSSSITCLITASVLSAPVFSAENSDLVYEPVEPCRIVNTTQGPLGSLTDNGNQAFLAWSTDANDLTNQGGGDCPQPRAGSKPWAIAANVTAVARGFKSKGNLTAYPNGSAVPTTSLVNFEANNIANSSIISLDPDNLKHFDIFARIPAGSALADQVSPEVHVIIDVIGYFYPQKEQSLHHVIKVSASNGDFTNPIDAMAAIPTGADAPSATNPYLIMIGPGEYELPAPARLLMQDYVNIQGAGKEVTIIKGAGFGSSAADQATVLGSNHTTLSNLTVKNTGGANYATAISSINTDSSFHINEVAAMAMNATVAAIAINNTGASPHINHVMAKAIAGGNSNIGISTTGNNAKPVITATTASAEGALANIGMSMDSGAQATVRNSVLKGTEAALEVTSTSGATTINFSTIMGPVVNDAAVGILSCHFNVDGSNVELDANCED